MYSYPPLRVQEAPLAEKHLMVTSGLQSRFRMSKSVIFCQISRYKFHERAGRVVNIRLGHAKLKEAETFTEYG